MTQRASLPKILLLASTGYAVLNLLHWPLGFTFFTQLSNLYIAAVVLLQLLRPELRALPALKFGAVVSIFVTFFVYLTVLGPVMPGDLRRPTRRITEQTSACTCSRPPSRSGISSAATPAIPIRNGMPFWRSFRRSLISCSSSRWGCSAFAGEAA